MNAFKFRFVLITTSLIAAFFLTNSVAQAASADVATGQSVTLSATADGSAPFTYVWYKDGVVLSGATNSTYTISSFQPTNTGTYYSVISNSSGSTTSANAILALSLVTAAPAFTTQPVSQTVAAGTAVTFTAGASGNPTPTYQWKKSGVNISGATSATYTIASTVSGDAGTYTVVATNSVSSVTSSVAALTISSTTSAPAFTTQPASQTVTAGGSVTFSAAASGNPIPTYQWKKAGVNISGATSASYLIASTVTGDAGSYTVVATNSVSSVTSSAATLTVNAAVTAPTISTQPVSQTIVVGNSVTFSVVASGSPTPTYGWHKNGVGILGVTGPSYTIASVTSGDAGTYMVVVGNTAGTVFSNDATLTVNAATRAPAFTTQPASQTVTAGASVTFTAAASGNPTPTYQWKKAGVNISGATSASYTIANTTTGSAGTYTVVATNVVSSVTSSTATLTVNSSVIAPSVGIIAFSVE